MTTQQVTITGRSDAIRPTAFEAAIIRDTGPITLDMVRDETTSRDADEWYAYMRSLLGMAKKVGAWLTLPDDNDKLGKGPIKGAGLTLSPADELVALLSSLDDAQLERIGAIIGITGRTEILLWALRMNPCPRSTPGCRAACVIRTAGNNRFPSTVRGRAARTLTLLTEPLYAARLTVDRIDKFGRAVGPGGGVIRAGVGDDIRAEIYMPAMLEAAAANGLGAHAYTKWDVRQRPDCELVHLTRSATGEGGRWNWASIIGHARRGHNVAVALRIPRGRPLPRSIDGVPVIDGDASDNRCADPRGCIVGLRAKGAAIGSGSAFLFDVPTDRPVIW